MVCGHCGTEINPGFNTCPACGALYVRGLGCLGILFGLPGLALLFASAVFWTALNNNAVALLLFALGCGMLWMCVKVSLRFRWERHEGPPR